jgi:hypothetical protein
MPGRTEDAGEWSFLEELALRTIELSISKDLKALGKGIVFQQKVILFNRKSEFAEEARRLMKW